MIYFIFYFYIDLLRKKEKEKINEWMNYNILNVLQK